MSGEYPAATLFFSSIRFTASPSVIRSAWTFDGVTCEPLISSRDTDADFKAVSIASCSLIRSLVVLDPFEHPERKRIMKSANMHLQVSVFRIYHNPSPT